MDANRDLYEPKIIEAIEQEEHSEHSDRITFSNGVVLGFKKVNIMRIQSIANRFEYPPVPKIKNEDKDRWEENPNDPQYIKACEKVDYQQGMAVIDAIAAFGTYPLHVPDGVSKVEDDEWIDELELFGIEVNRHSKLARYYGWVKYVAVVDQDDLMILGQQFGVTMGSSERLVKDQLRSSFQDHEI